MAIQNNDKLCLDKRLHARNVYYRLKLIHYPQLRNKVKKRAHRIELRL